MLGRKLNKLVKFFFNKLKRERTPSKHIRVTEWSDTPAYNERKCDLDEQVFRHDSASDEVCRSTIAVHGSMISLRENSEGSNINRESHTCVKGTLLQNGDRPASEAKCEILITSTFTAGAGKLVKAAQQGKRIVQKLIRAFKIEDDSSDKQPSKLGSGEAQVTLSGPRHFGNSDNEYEDKDSIMNIEISKRTAVSEGDWDSFCSISSCSDDELFESETESVLDIDEYVPSSGSSNQSDEFFEYETDSVSDIDECVPTSGSSTQSDDHSDDHFVMQIETKKRSGGTESDSDSFCSAPECAEDQNDENDVDGLPSVQSGITPVSQCASEVRNPVPLLKRRKPDSSWSSISSSEDDIDVDVVHDIFKWVP